MVREQHGNKQPPAARHTPITFTNRHKRYVQSHLNNQQRIRIVANGFPEVIVTKKRMTHQPKHASSNQHTDKPITDEKGLHMAYNSK